MTAMRIHELEISDVRGVRRVALSPGGRNVVVWGPNGSGKSAVVDAVDFLLKGSISRLEGEGAGSLSTAKHGPHIDAKPATAKVRALVTLPSCDSPFDITRTMVDPANLQCTDKHGLEALGPVLDVARQGQYVLTRREILRFITATGGNRAKWIQSLMRLDSLESIRAVLVRVANDAEKQAAAAARTVDEERSAFCAATGMDNWNEEKALAAVNVARVTLGATESPTLEPGKIKDGLAVQAITKADADAVRLAQALEQLRDTWENLPTLRDAADELALAAVSLGQDSEALTLLRRHALIHAGLELLEEDGACPLCGTEWQQGELGARLNEHLRLSKDVAKKHKELEALVADLKPQVTALRQTAAAALTTATSLGVCDEASLLAKVATSLKAYEEALATSLDKLGSEIVDLFAVPTILSDKAVEPELQRLGKTAAELSPQLTPEQAAWDLLSRLEDAVARIHAAQAKAGAADTLHTRAGLLRNSYCQAKDDILNGLYDAIKARFVELYSQLHAEDGEDAFEALLEHDGASLDFRVEFFGRGLHPPQALHSEGHQDSMGICLYLALSEHVNKGAVGVTVLDDVVMSVDSGHRRRLCQVLKEHFPDTQFIITTHDRGWAHQLKTEGVVAAEDMVQFCGWNIDTGPRINKSDVWERIDECLANDDVRGAASYLRGAMEEFFANACESLQARVIYRASGQYTLGDYLPAAYSRYTKLVKDAKTCSASWGKKDVVDELNKTHSVAKQCYSRTEAEQWATNKALHYDAWYSLEAPDLKGVVDAFRDLCHLFQCPDCGTMLAVSITGSKIGSVVCACKRTNWNMAKKAAS